MNMHVLIHRRKSARLDERPLCSDCRRRTIAGAITVMQRSGCSDLATGTSLSGGYAGYCGLRTLYARLTPLHQPFSNRLDWWFRHTADLRRFGLQATKWTSIFLFDRYRQPMSRLKRIRRRTSAGSHDNSFLYAVNCQRYAAQLNLVSIVPSMGPIRYEEPRLR